MRNGVWDEGGGEQVEWLYVISNEHWVKSTLELARFHIHEKLKRKACNKINVKNIKLKLSYENSDSGQRNIKKI